MNGLGDIITDEISFSKYFLHFLFHNLGKGLGLTLHSSFLGHTIVIVQTDLINVLQFSQRNDQDIDVGFGPLEMGLMVPALLCAARLCSFALFLFLQPSTFASSNVGIATTVDSVNCLITSQSLKYNVGYFLLAELENYITAFF